MTVRPTDVDRLVETVRYAMSNAVAMKAYGYYEAAAREVDRHEFFLSELAARARDAEQRAAMNENLLEGMQTASQGWERDFRAAEDRVTELEGALRRIASMSTFQAHASGIEMQQIASAALAAGDSGNTKEEHDG